MYSSKKIRANVYNRDRDNILAKMGFDNLWIKWMSMCVESVDYRS